MNDEQITTGYLEAWLTEHFIRFTESGKTAIFACPATEFRGIAGSNIFLVKDEGDTSTSYMSEKWQEEKERGWLK